MIKALQRVDYSPLNSFHDITPKLVLSSINESLHKMSVEERHSYFKPIGSDMDTLSRRAAKQGQFKPVSVKSGDSEILLQYRGSFGAVAATKDEVYKNEKVIQKLNCDFQNSKTFVNYIDLIVFGELFQLVWTIYRYEEDKF